MDPTINYRQFYERVKRHYPTIAAEFSDASNTRNFKALPEIIKVYLEISNVKAHELLKNKDDSFNILPLVIAMLYGNSKYSVQGEYYRYGLMQKLVKMVGCERRQILYRNRTAKGLYKVNKVFTEKVNNRFRELSRLLSEKGIKIE